MNDKNHNTVIKLHEIDFYIALQEVPFTMFEHQTNLEKQQGVDYTGAYENKTARITFIIDIPDDLLHEGWKRKLELVNSFSIFLTVQQTKVVFVLFTGPEIHQPVMKYFDAAAPEVSQNDSGLKEAILTAFK